MIFENITWAQYLASAGLITGGYYLFILRKDLGKIASKGSAVFDHKGTVQAPDVAVRADEEEEDAFEKLNQLIDDLRDVMEEAGNEVSKAALVDRLKQRLTSYDGLSQPAFHVAVNDFIIDQAKEICGVVFEEEELRMAWSTLPR